jgi:hypothetical protein
MVQPKYSPKEALNKIKLMMNYDSSKTLTENKVTIKSVISEGGKDAAVRAILDKCSAANVDLGKARMDVQDHIDMAALFDKAFSSAFGTDNEAWRKALKKMSVEGVFEDLCAIATQYEELASESFADGIDADIDYDNEYTEFTTAFQKMIKRGTQGGLKVKNAQSSDIAYFEKTFPCIFQSDANVDQKTDTDVNKYTFIRIKSDTGKQYAVFYDGRIKTIDTPGGQPVKQTGRKISCNGSKIGFIAESIEKKKSIKEQFKDSDLEGGGGVPDPNPTPTTTNGGTPSPTPTPNPVRNDFALEQGALTTPGDPYQYKVVDGKWYTKSWKNRGKIITNWVSLENNQNATNELDRRHPGVRVAKNDIKKEKEVNLDDEFEDVDGTDPNDIIDN